MHFPPFLIFAHAHKTMLKFSINCLLIKHCFSLSTVYLTKAKTNGLTSLKLMHSVPSSSLVDVHALSNFQKHAANAIQKMVATLKALSFLKSKNWVRCYSSLSSRRCTLHLTEWLNVLSDEYTYSHAHVCTNARAYAINTVKKQNWHYTKAQICVQ